MSRPLFQKWFAIVASGTLDTQSNYIYIRDIQLQIIAKEKRFCNNN